VKKETYASPKQREGRKTTFLEMDEKTIHCPDEGEGGGGGGGVGWGGGGGGGKNGVKFSIRKGVFRESGKNGKEMVTQKRNWGKSGVYGWFSSTLERLG